MSHSDIEHGLSTPTPNMEEGGNGREIIGKQLQPPLKGALLAAYVKFAYMIILPHHCY